MYPVLFEIAGRVVTTWMVMALMGVCACYLVMGSDLRNKDIPNWQILLGGVGAVFAWFLGAHFGQIITVGSISQSTEAGFRFSGLVLYGGLIGFLMYGLVYWLALGWSKKILLQEIWDSAALGLAWAFFLGRIGCFLYGCCYGTPSGKWPGYFLNEKRWDYKNLAFPKELFHIELHPAPLYEALAFLFIIGVTYWMRFQERKKPGSFPPGVPGWFCWILYGIVRYFLEFIRLDARGESYLGYSPSQWIALLTVAIGLFLIQWEKKQARVPIYFRKKQ